MHNESVLSNLMIGNHQNCADTDELYDSRTSRHSKLEVSLFHQTPNIWHQEIC